MSNEVTVVHMCGYQFAELAVDFCRIGLFPACGVDDSGEFVLGPFVHAATNKTVFGCGSVYWDGEAKEYRWSLYLQHEGKEVRGIWKIGKMPDELLDMFPPTPVAAHQSVPA